MMLCVKILSFVFVLKFAASQSEDTPQKLQQRFLGTLNRYYVSSWAQISQGNDYLNFENSASAINALDMLTGNEDVAIIVHGRSGSAFSEFAQTLRSSFLVSNENTVVILVDWAVMSSLDYVTAVTAAPFIADDIISMIIQMEALNKIDRSRVNLVGFDIGAHIAGMVSRDPRARVQRITGLDPAGTNWDAFSRRLRPTDAQYVEVIHTDGSGSRALGIGEVLGSLDFFINAGTNQPGCSNNQCNHDRAWQLFAATLDMGGHLVGLKCDTLAQMSNNRCTGAPAMVVGTNAFFKLGTGIYRVNTGRNYPYSA